MPSPTGQVCAALTCATPVVTGMGMSCTLLQITLTGADFVTDAPITLTGPDGAIAFTLVSQSSTTRVLQLSLPFTSGTYCATVGASNTLCVALACAFGCALGPVAPVTGHLGCATIL